MSQTPSQSTSEAREKARRIAQKQAKRPAGNSSRRWLQVSVFAVLLAIIVIVAIVWTQSTKGSYGDEGPVPASANQYGGIVITKDGIVKDSSEKDTRNSTQVDESSVTYTGEDGEETVVPLGLADPEEAKKNGEPVRVTIFQDYNCVHCHEFEEQYGGELKQKVLDGEITLELRNLNFLDQPTSQYSSRAAMAAYLVAEQVTPEQFFDFEEEVFSHEGQGSLSNKELSEIAQKHGASDIKGQLDSNEYRPMVETTVNESTANGVRGTPTIFVDSQLLQQEDFSAFLQQLQDAKGEGE